MLLQLQKHLQTVVRPFQVRSHVTQKLGQISKICSIQKLDIVPWFQNQCSAGYLPLGAAAGVAMRRRGVVDF